MYNGSFTDKLKLLFKLHIPPGEKEAVLGFVCLFVCFSFSFFLQSLALATVQSCSCNTDVYFFAG